MAEKKEITFTEGPVFRALVRFALPVLGSLVLQSAYGAVDLLVVGRFGDASSISAVGTGSSFMNMLTLIITSLATGSTVIIGQHIGEKNADTAGDAIGTTIILFAGIGIILTLLLEVSAGGIAQLLNVPEASYNKAVLYLRICSGGILVIITYNLISSIFRGIGNANLPFLFVGVACAVNIAADLILTGLLHLDVTGVAIATVFAQLVSVIFSFFIIRRQRLPITFSIKKCRIYPAELQHILKVGIPLALQELLVQISFIAINSIVNNMGLMPSAGYGVAQRLVNFIMLVPSALMQSVAAFVAQNIGAGQPKRARNGYLTVMLTGVCAGFVFFLVGFFGSSLLSSIFTSDPAVIVQSSNYMKGFSFDCILTCLVFSTTGYFNGLGNSVPVMIQGITSAFCIRIPAALILSSLSNTSLFYIGLAAPITSAYGILFYAICFAVLSWRRQKKQT